MNVNQLQLLQLIGVQGVANLLKARTKLSWDLEKFSVALHSLETAGLIRRDGFKASCTAEGVAALGVPFPSGSSHAVRRDGSKSYADEVMVPRLPINEPWLPNLEGFLHAIGIRK